MSVTKVGNKYVARGKVTMADGIRKDYKRLFDKKSDAIEFDTDYKKLFKNKLVQSKTITFKEAAALYIDNQKGKKKESSIITDERTLKVINDKIGDKKIGSFNIHNLEDIMKEFYDKGYANNTLEKYHFNIQKVLEFCRKRGYIDYNPMKDVDKIKQRDVIKDDDVVLNCWTPKEFKKFIAVVDNQYWNDVFTFLYYMGTRRGELIGLQWNYVDFDKKTIKIAQQLNFDAGGKLTTPKSEASKRNVMMPNKITDLMTRRYKEASDLHGFKKDWFVFGNDTHMARTTLLRKLDEYIEKANVKRITPHGFKHSHVSYLINKNKNVFAIAARVGDTPQVLMKTYAHLFKESERELIKAIDQL